MRCRGLWALEIQPGDAGSGAPQAPGSLSATAAAMTAQFRLRLGLLVAAILLVAAVTFVAVQYSWRRIHELERKLTSNHLETFRLADDFQQRLLSLNNAMMRYAARRENSTWTEFERASTNLD